MGWIAEALGVAVLESPVKWAGGNRKGYDAIDAQGQKFEIKHAARKQAIFDRDIGAEPAISFFEGQRKTDTSVKYLLVVFYTTPQDETLKPERETSVMPTGSGWEVRTTTIIPQVDIYELDYDSLCRHFVRGYTRKGTLGKGLTSQAREEDLEPYRVSIDRRLAS